MRMVVDFPAPLGPRNPVTYPGFDVEAEIVDGQILAVALREIAGLDGVGLPPDSAVPSDGAVDTTGSASDFFGLLWNRIGLPDRMRGASIPSTPPHPQKDADDGGDQKYQHHDPQSVASVLRPDRQHLVDHH